MLREPAEWNSICRRALSRRRKIRRSFTWDTRSTRSGRVRDGPAGQRDFGEEWRYRSTRTLPVFPPIGNKMTTYSFLGNSGDDGQSWFQLRGRRRTSILRRTIRRLRLFGRRARFATGWSEDISRSCDLCIPSRRAIGARCWHLHPRESRMRMIVCSRFGIA